jgi:hypothetical protein
LKHAQTGKRFEVKLPAGAHCASVSMVTCKGPPN